jgi:hypothetical protein
MSGDIDAVWSAWSISVARSLSWLFPARASLKRRGEGVSAGEGRPALGAKRVLARGLVEGVVKISVFAPEVGVGHAAALSLSNSSRLRFPGV